jgi:hypothetical protein
MVYGTIITAFPLLLLGVAVKRVFEDEGCRRWLIKKNKERITNVANLLQILYS